MWSMITTLNASRDEGIGPKPENAVAGSKLRCDVSHMVVAGLGVAVLPREAIQPHLRSMNLKQISLQDSWPRAAC
jgi:DNA-binding transcriptional LysR family regulator